MNASGVLSVAVGVRGELEIDFIGCAELQPEIPVTAINNKAINS